MRLPTTTAAHRLFSTAFASRSEQRTQASYFKEPRMQTPNRIFMDSLERPTLEQRKSWLKFRRPGDVAPGYIAILEVEPSQDQLKQVEEFVHQQWKDKTSLIIPPDDVHGPEALPRYQSATPTQSRGYKGDSESTTFRNANSDDNEKVSVHIMRNMCVNLRFRLPSGDPELLDEMEKKLPFIHVVQETATMELCSQEVKAASETVLLPANDLHYSSTVQSELTSNGGGTFAYVLDSWGGDLPRRQNYYIEDLGGRIQKWPGRTYTTNSKSGHQDVVGHGTVVASLLGGDKHGQANKTTIIPVKVVEDNGRGNSDLMAEALCEILEHAQNEGTVSRSVVNISMSGFRVALDNLNKTVNELNRNGLLCIVASGNERQDTSLVVPASARTALTVGAVDENDKESDYSNAGKHVAVFSSGDLDSRDPAYSSKDRPQGTSFAAPRIAGLALRILGSEPKDCELQPHELHELVLYHARDGPVELRSRSTLLARLNKYAWKS